MDSETAAQGGVITKVSPKLWSPAGLAHLISAFQFLPETFTFSPTCSVISPKHGQQHEM